MKKILLALSLLYLAFCETLSCLGGSTPSQASDCIQRTPKSNDNMCCYAKYKYGQQNLKGCCDVPKALSTDEIKKQLIEKFQQEYPGITIEDFSCSGSYLKIGLLLLTAFLL